MLASRDYRSRVNAKHHLGHDHRCGPDGRRDPVEKVNWDFLIDSCDLKRRTGMSILHEKTDKKECPSYI